MTSLTLVEARARAEQVSVTRYSIALDLTLGDRLFGSVTEVRFASSGPDGATFLDLTSRELRSATLNGRELDLARCFDADAGRITLTGLAPENVLVVDAVMAYSHDGEGLHRHVDPADGNVYLYAMSFLDAGPRWFACFDQPDLKALVTIDVTCPTDWTVAGNGPATQLSPGRWQIASTEPLATYFTTIVAGQYHSVRAEHDGISLALHVRASLADELDEQAEEIFATTRHCFDALHELFGVRYPWGEYHQAFVPDFNAGAMENPGCVTLRDQYVFRSRPSDGERFTRAVTVAHEMAHMWFGDLVTMRWWDDLWLNESFAEYLGHRALGEHTWVEFGVARKSWGHRADRRPSTHPVAGNGAPDAETALSSFDGISYAKGASVLRQLASHLGDATFLAGLRDHITSHAYGNAELADLLGSWRAAGAENIVTWADAWLRTSGMDELRVGGDELVRTPPDDRPGGARRAHSLTVARIGAGGSASAQQAVRVAADRTPLELGGTGGLVLPDAADETWAKIALDAGTWAAMPTVLAGVTEARSRVVVWNALRLAVADAEIDPRLAMDIVVGSLPAETNDDTVAAVGRWACQTATAYLPDAARCDALDRIGAAMRAVATAAAPAGSGLQLAAARLVVAAATDPVPLQSWLDGVDVPDGLVIDAELRWALLRQLAALGGCEDSDIAAELARDNTAQAVVHAAGARAARPDHAAKAAAWDILSADGGHSNYELYAVGQSFWPAGQQDYTADYVPRFFAELPAWARFRTGMLADRLADLAFPWTAVHDDTLDAAARIVAHGELPAGTRTAIGDAADDLRRALVARRRFES